MNSWVDESYRRRTLRSSLAVVVGTLTMTLATYAVLQMTRSFEYLFLAGTSTLAAILIGMGMKPSLLGDRYLERDWPNAIFIGAGGVVLGLEVVLVAMIFSNGLSALYALATLAAVSTTLWGNHSLNSLRIALPVRERQLAEKILST